MSYQLSIVIPHTTKELKCDCYSPMQDKLFGEGVRIHTLVKQGNGKIKWWYCTCCNGLKRVNKETPSND